MTPEKKQEILETYKWIKVKRYKSDETKSRSEGYRDLEVHHLEETNFLIDKIRQIVSKII